MEAAPPGWPLVLAGPLVRRVEEASASVFVACRDPVTVRLSIYDGTGPGRVAVATAHAGTVPLGRFLHVAVVISARGSGSGRSWLDSATPPAITSPRWQRRSPLRVAASPISSAGYSSAPGISGNGVMTS
jgi:hypothetical protein